MRQISVNQVRQAVRDLCIRQSYLVPPDIEACVHAAQASETSEQAKYVLGQIIENHTIAAAEQMPLCQDTGMACVFIALGQQVQLIDGDLYTAIHQGVREGYREGFLRKSIVQDPLVRQNTDDNTPAFIHVDIVPGDVVTIIVAAKGAGSENMSRLAMLNPAAGRQGVIDFVLDTVRRAGANPCPPIVVGVGIGGNFDTVAHLAKKAALRPLNIRHDSDVYVKLELELLDEINKLNIGSGGFGGKTTALGVNIETSATHIAALPVAVNINCHVTRRESVTI